MTVEVLAVIVGGVSLGMLLSAGLVVVALARLSNEVSLLRAEVGDAVVSHVDHTGQQERQLLQWTQETFRHITDLAMLKTAPLSAPTLIREARLREAEAKKPEPALEPSPVAFPSGSTVFVSEG